METTQLIQRDGGAIVVECCHSKRWLEVESRDESLIVTVPRMYINVARVVLFNDVVGSSMASPKQSIDGAPDQSLLVMLSPYTQFDDMDDESTKHGVLMMEATRNDESRVKTQ